MRNTIYITVPGQPKSQKRHRHFKRESFTGTYDPSADDKKSFLSYIADKAPKEPLKGPIHLEIIFYMKRPKGHYGTGKNEEKVKDSAPSYHTSKPDVSNLVKFVEDAMNSIFWYDDSQIYLLRAEKNYHTKPLTYIEIYYESH